MSAFYLETEQRSRSCFI
jgi:hypothetical protein